MLKYVNQIIVFLIELVMIASFAYFGFQKGNTMVIKVALAITIPVIAILLWGYLAAPKSANRLNMPYLVLFRLAMFLIASYFLYKCNQPKLAIILALFSITTQVLSYFIETH